MALIFGENLARFIFFITLTLFLVIGVMCFFLSDIDAHHNIEKTTDNNNYSAYVLEDDFAIRSVLQRIVSECSYGNSECVTVKAYKYIKDDIKLLKEGANGRQPKNTLMYKNADIGDKAFLLASFLENAGIESKITYENGKLIVYAINLNLLKLYDEIMKDLYSNPLAERRVTLSKDGKWIVNIGDKGNTSIPIDIEVNASKPVQMLLFPNETELNSYIQEQNG